MSADAIERLNAALSGRYHIERELGEGGMATVYLADDLKHERKVALKVLKPELAAVVGAERFLAEIKTTANLQHPHILPLFDSGEADSFLFYVMPYIEGETLRERIDREKQLPVDEALGIAIAAANALQAAHDHGIVHRDIKPGNILLSSGQPLVADFGIALAVGAAGGRLTETGLSLGTPYYMSPEQATGDQVVGPASDTFALACVLYEMLVGEPPYPGTTAQAVLGKIIQGMPVSATVIRRSIPANVDAAIRKALEKLPADRFTGAHDFAKALADPSFRYGEEAEGRVSASGWNRVTRGFAASTAVLAVALGWTLLAPEPELPQRVERFSLSIPENHTPDEQLNISPDGSMMVFRALNDNGQPQLFLRRWEELEATPIPDTEGDLHDPVISPDGSEVVYVQDNQLKVAPLRGGLIRTLAGDAICCSRWGPDGYIYFSPIGRTIRRVRADGSGEVEQITELDQENDASHGYFQVLPGGEVGVFTVWGPPRRVEVMDLATGERRRLIEGAVRSYVTPTGHLVFAALDGRIMAAPFDAETMALTGPEVPLVDGIGITGQDDAMYSVSEEGTLIYWSSPTTQAGAFQLVSVTRAGEATVIDPTWEFDTGGAESWSLSPDGGRVAIAENTGTGQDIWVKTLPDGPRSKLTFDAGFEWKPRWSPDGETVTFLSDRAGDMHVWSRRADGTGDAQLVFEHENISGDGFWGPNAEWLVLRTGGGAGAGALRDILAVRPGADSVPIPLLAVPGRAEAGPALSPDGRWLAYSSDETGRNEVFVRAFPDVDSFKRQVSTQGAIKPMWAHSGSELFFVNANREMVAATVETEGGFRVVGQETLFAIPASYPATPNIDFYDVAPDDESFVMARRVQRDESGGTPELILVRNWFEEIRQRLGN